jgi:hypothetical protein
MRNQYAWVVVVLVGCGGARAPGSDGTADSGIGIDTATSDDEPTGSGSEGESEGPDPTECDPACADGEVCVDGRCMQGCDDDSTCGGLSCCDGACIDLTADAANCGACGEPCGTDLACTEGQCVLGECPAGSNDCNGDPGDGCETDGDCTCTPGATQDCYTFEPETQDVGECHSGTQTCNEFGTAWNLCDGEAGPENSDLCANGLDDNCNGMADEDLDADGDGFTACGGDCCDEPGAVCSNPDLVNPGAFEVDGNMVDDDCDGTADNPLDACDAGLASNSGDALDYARAIDLCQFTEETPADPADAIWGVIEAELTRANGMNTPNANARSIRDDFGSSITTRFGARLAVLSTGHAADDDDDSNPNFASFQGGQTFANMSSAMPADWLAANGNNVPNAPGCPDPLNNNAYNPAMLTVRVRAPTNANSFSVEMYFFSAEYPEWVCTEYNDFFVTLIDSSDPGNPADGNIAIYDDGASTWPVGINLVSTAAGLFTQCANGNIGQCGDGGSYNGCTGTGELTGTGFDVVFDGPDLCCPNARIGGGTGWLRMSGNVEPGETFEIRFAIWDTSDALYDSLVLLDNWQWSVDASEPGVRPS